MIKLEKVIRIITRIFYQQSTMMTKHILNQLEYFWLSFVLYLPLCNVTIFMSILPKS